MLLGITLEAISKGKPRDYGMIESLHCHFKNDYVCIQEPMSFAETKLMLAAAVRHYNGKRPHSSLGYLTPSEYRKSAEKPVEVKRKAMQLAKNFRLCSTEVRLWRVADLQRSAS